MATFRSARARARALGGDSAINLNWYPNVVSPRPLPTNRSRKIMARGDRRSAAVATTQLARLPAPQPEARAAATSHRLHLGDARTLDWLADASVHLVVTSPPYWTLKLKKSPAGFRDACGGCPAARFKAAAGGRSGPGDRWNTLAPLFSTGWTVPRNVPAARVLPSSSLQPGPLPRSPLPGRAGPSFPVGRFAPRVIRLGRRYCAGRDPTEQGGQATDTRGVWQPWQPWPASAPIRLPPPPPRQTQRPPPPPATQHHRGHPVLPGACYLDLR
jgi:hypothetical protein